MGIALFLVTMTSLGLTTTTEETDVKGTDEGGGGLAHVELLQKRDVEETGEVDGTADHLLEEDSCEDCPSPPPIDGWRPLCAVP